MPIHSVITHTSDLQAPLRVTPLRHHLVSGDDQGDRFEISVTRGGQPESVAGGSVMGYFVREADGATIPVPGSASGSTAAVTLPEACYALSGRFTLTVKVTVGQARHALAVFEGAVLRSATDTIIDTGHTIPDINELLAMIDQIEQATAKANKAAADADGEAKKANDAAAFIRGVTTGAHAVAPGGSPTATPSEAGGHLHINFGLVKGDKGDKGDTGSIDNLLVNGKAAEGGRIDLDAGDVPLKTVATLVSGNAYPDKPGLYRVAGMKLTNLALPTYYGFLMIWQGGYDSSFYQLHVYYDSNGSVYNGFYGDSAREIKEPTAWHTATLPDALAKAATAGLTGDITPGFGGSFPVPGLTVSPKGLVTALSARKVTLPNPYATTTTLVSGSAYPTDPGLYRVAGMRFDNLSANAYGFLYILRGGGATSFYQCHMYFDSVGNIYNGFYGDSVNVIKEPATWYKLTRETAAKPASAMSDAELALVELGGIVAEQQAAIVELAEMMTTRMERGDM